MRRPLMSVRVDFWPRPRSEMPAEPRAKLPVNDSSKEAAEFAGRLRSTSATVLDPERSICSREMICTGAGPSASTRLMFEPVTSIFSTFCVCCANAAVVAPASAAVTTASQRLSENCIAIIPPGSLISL